VSVSVYAERPWVALYDSGVPADLRPEATSALEMFEASLARAPDAPLIQYFDRTLTLRESET
jgi:long-chain acyl-CoA synthetase